ncbi:hypothetical protein MSPP1_004157 [Malassezia sp. CBS 17886]|nr:hypothetical protein MSPP1_004157 [Malassezia sp. CBS 17886]
MSDAVASSDAAASAHRRARKKVPRYDEYGNYLGDFAPEDPAASATPAAPAASATPPPPVQTPAQAPAFPPPGYVRAMPRALPGAGHARTPAAGAAAGPLLFCGVDTALLSARTTCAFSTRSEQEMMLHRADRHLLYPAGGIAEVRRRDPMYIAMEKERTAQQRRGAARGADGPTDATILGLNIRLDTPELVAEWIRQRQKRYPSAAVIAQKNADAQRRQARLAKTAALLGQPGAAQRGAAQQDAAETAHRGPTRGTQKDAAAAAPPSPGSDTHNGRDRTESESGDSDASSSAPDGASASDSDMDPVRDAVSSKVDPVLPRAQPASDQRPMCRFWQRGHCNFGDQCRQRHGEHDTSTGAKRGAADEAPRARRRPAPRLGAVNPFQAPDLLRQLLGNEILQHVDAVSQLLRFLLDNDMLAHVERRRGDAAEQRARRARVVPLVGAADGSGGGEAGGQGTEAAAEAGGERVAGGAEAVGSEAATNEPSRYGTYDAATAASPLPPPFLPSPTSPTLRPLSELVWPPEPDPLVYLDPLRRADPKPLRPAELEALAVHPRLREILHPASPLHPQGALNVPLQRAMQTWEALPTERHRIAALELILGVGAASPLHAHDAYAPETQRHLAPTAGAPGKAGGARVIGETELFRLGLRIGPTEVALVQHIAECVSAEMRGPEFCLS